MTPLDRYEIADAGIANGAITMIAAIVRLLEEKSIVPVDEFATALEGTAAAAEADPHSPFPPGSMRMDTLMMRQVAKTLRKQKKQGGWKPVVIRGGLSDKQGQENPD